MTTKHKPWEALSGNALEQMRELGDFSPTTRASDKMVKDCTLDADGDPGKTYWDSEDLRKIAAACAEVADWLDKRAEAATGAAA